MLALGRWRVSELRTLTDRALHEIVRLPVSMLAGGWWRWQEKERGREIKGEGRERNDYEVKAGPAFNGRHKAPFPSGARAFETITRAFFNARFIEIDYADRGNRR